MGITLDWQMIIGLVTLALVIFTIVWGTGLWTRREKVKIKITTIDYPVHGVKKELKVYLGSELQRSRGKEMRYITQVLLKPEQQTYSELRGYFNLPANGQIEFNGRIRLPRDQIVRWPTEPAVYSELPTIGSTEERDKAQEIALELSKKKHKVGLVWEDSKKTTWKTISKEHYGEWVRL